MQVAHMASHNIIFDSQFTVPMDLNVRKSHWHCCLQATKAQTSLRIRAVWSAPLLFHFSKVYHLNFLHAHV